MLKFYRWLDGNLEEYLLLVFSLIMVGITFLQVIMRYIFNDSILWAEELSRYCFIWLVFIGASYGVKNDTHIKIDVIVQFLKGKGEKVFNIISLSAFLIFAIFLTISGYQVTEQLLEWNQKSPAMHLPMWLVYMAIPLGMLLVILRLLQKLYWGMIGNKTFTR